MTPKLAALIERARRYFMTPEEVHEQSISFAYGNAGIEDPTITKGQVRRISEDMRDRDSPA